MKKIVALALTLVMVLGLATVASAATVEYDLYDADGELVSANVTWTYEVEDATPAALNPAVGAVQGTVEYVVLTTSNGTEASGYYVECAKADADVYLTIDGQTGAVMYLKKVSNVDYTVANVFTNIGTACGQLNVNKKYDYYSVTNVITKSTTYYVGTKDTAGSVALLVNGELVQANVVGIDNENAHVWEIAAIDADHTVTDITCELCGVDAKCYETKLAAPKGAIFDATYGWIVVGAAVEAPVVDTEKVESAETFDAGIAMYVGMSVMAAAGSAVVLKKKED